MTPRRGRGSLSCVLIVTVAFGLAISKNSSDVRMIVDSINAELTYFF
jgi:hypothetical protein